MGIFQVNSYLLTCEETGKTVVVDPGDEPDILLRRLDELGVEPEAILNTHGHVDHVAGNARLRERYDIPILMHPEDRFLVDGFKEQAAMFGLTLAPPPPPDADLTPGEAYAFGACSLDVHFTPGHSPGHVALVHGRQAISGDVLFAGSIGRTDLPGGSLEVLLKSIDEVLVPLGDDLEIHPGHGPA
ncbi:MAG: MBL fold metallo-hydrolase, partial [Gemmatimonadetes bacterium]|nr:MBL fold metallo-hydrolase [Gemmatimonadota bacterium]